MNQFNKCRLTTQGTGKAGEGIGEFVSSTWRKVTGKSKGTGEVANQGTRLLDKPIAGDNIGVNLRPSANPSTPDFIVSPGGTAVVVPKGSVDPVPVNTGWGGRQWVRQKELRV